MRLIRAAGYSWTDNKEPRLGKVVRHEGEGGPADEGDNFDQIRHSGVTAGWGLKVGKAVLFLWLEITSQIEID